MKNVRAIFALAAFLLMWQSSALADDLQPIQDLTNKARQAYSQHQMADAARFFNQALDKIKVSSEAQQDPTILVIIGALGCGLPGHDAEGKAALNRVLRTNKGVAADPAKARELQKLLASCSRTQDEEDVASTTIVVPAVASVSDEPTVSGTFKGGYLMAPPVAPVSVSRIAPSDLQRRLKETENAGTALNATLKRFVPGAHGTVTDHFIVVTEGSQADAAGVAKCLDQYGADLSSQFDMQFPSHLITVYNMSSEQKVYNEAGLLHGLRLGRGTIAYSVYDDLSMVGVGAPTGCGSLAHELTHLMIRGNFADAPAWLEEGLASAVALATAGQQLTFHKGWRDDVLNRQENLRPPVAELLNLSWADFSSEKSGPEKAAAIQAMASVFIRYLADHGKLDDVYLAVRKQNLAADLDHYRSPQQILEAQLGKKLMDVDKDFDSWFRKQTAERTGSTHTQRSSDDAPPCAANTMNAMAQQAPPPCESERKK
ncbi:MAG TPA: hypothetical protein VJV96_04280 [Candidatus Angelobacter sp.]|nr:hypothetical protein [Candidatus Angelobacter sp.]